VKKKNWREKNIRKIKKALQQKCQRAGYCLAPQTKISWNQIIEEIRNIYKLKELINLPVSVPNNV